MALIEKGWYLNVDWVDKGSNVGRSRILLTVTDTAGDMDLVVTAAAAVLASLAAGSDCVVSGYQLSKSFVEDALTLPTSGNAEIEMKAHLVAKITGDPTESGVFDLPGPKDSMFIATSGPDANVVKVGSAPANAIVQIFQLGGSGYISDGETWVTATAKGKRIHKRSTRG